MAPLRSDEDVSDELFEIIGELGRGGFAKTYKAKVRDADLREELGTDIVALKVPLDKTKERVLKKEVETNVILHLRLKELQALNLVRYLGFEFFQGKVVMVMEFVSGGNLRDKLGKIGKQTALPVDEAVRITEGVLKGLSIMHVESIFHRDIKPENIMMDGNTPKIADLGIARLLKAQELASTTTGTLFYMSPEILSHDGASFTSDIWSIGVTLYELVTGRLPFANRANPLSTPMGAMFDLIREHKQEPASEVADVPKALSEVIDRSLQKNPADRFANANEMLEALKKFRKMPNDRLEAEMAAIRAELTAAGEQDGGIAEPKLKALVAKYPKEPRAYQYLGEFYNRGERYAEAIDVFKRGIALDDENAVLHWDLALAYQRAGQKERAARSLKTAIDRGLEPSLQRHAANLLKVLQA